MFNLRFVLSLFFALAITSECLAFGPFIPHGRHDTTPLERFSFALTTTLIVAAVLESYFLAPDLRRSMILTGMFISSWIISRTILSRPSVLNSLGDFMENFGESPVFAIVFGLG